MKIFTNACYGCEAALACITGMARYAFICTNCKNWFAQIPSASIHITNRNVCELEEMRANEIYRPIVCCDQCSKQLTNEHMAKVVAYGQKKKTWR